MPIMHHAVLGSAQVLGQQMGMDGTSGRQQRCEHCLCRHVGLLGGAPGLQLGGLEWYRKRQEGPFPRQGLTGTPPMYRISTRIGSKAS